MRPEGTTLEALDGKELEVLRLLAQRVVCRHEQDGVGSRELRQAVTDWRATVVAVEAEQRFRAQRMSAVGKAGTLVERAARAE